jgi:hypothetical protein
MEKSVSLLTIQFLAWVAGRRRTHAEARDAWQSTCPLNCAWEDAFDDDLIQFENCDGTPTPQSRIILTAKGRAILDRR